MRIGQEPQNLSAHRFGIAALDQTAGHSVGDKFRNAADARRDDRLTVGHSLGDHPAKNFLPARELADDVGGVEDTFAKRILNQASPGDPLSQAHFVRCFPVRRQIFAITDHDKLHVRVARGHYPRGLQKIIDAFFGNDPTDLRDDRALSRNVMASAKIDRPLLIGLHPRKIDGVIDHFKTIQRQQVKRSHAFVPVLADADNFGNRRIDKAGSATLPQRCPSRNIAGRPRTVIGEKNFFHGLKFRYPWIRCQKAAVMQMQDFGTMAPNEARQAPRSFEAAVTCARINFKLHIRQIEKPAHVWRRLAEKAERVCPAPLAQLTRELARESFRAADAARLNAQN